MDEPCLFDVVNDVSEYNDIAQSMPGIVSQMKERLAELSVDFWQNEENGVNSCPLGWNDTDLNYTSCGCWMAINNYNHFAGPYQDLTAEQINFNKEMFIFDELTNEYYSVYFWFYLSMSCVSIIALIKYCQTVMNGNKPTNNDQESERISKYGSITRMF